MHRDRGSYFPEALHSNFCGVQDSKLQAAFDQDDRAFPTHSISWRDLYLDKPQLYGWTPD